MSRGLLSVLADFFEVIGSQKAHWYRVFNPDDGAGNCTLIKSTFPSLASLMKMDSDFVNELLLEVGLAKKKLHRGAYIVYAVRSAWDSFIQKENLEMEATFFTINNKKSLYIKIGVWCNSRHHARTPGYIWKEATKAGCYNVPSFESLLQLSNLLGILASNLMLHPFLYHQKQKCKKKC